MTDDAGNVTDTYDYEAFGEVLNQTGTTPNSYLYTGEQYDANLNNYYLRARYYDQGVGRFTQQDTWMGINSDPVTLHKYLYANADPVNNIDPTGNFTIASLGAANNVRGVLTDVQINVGFNLFDSSIGNNVDPGTEAIGFAILSLGGSGVKLLGLLSKKGKDFLRSKGLLKCKSKCASKLIGKDYEDYLTMVLGGKGGFSRGGRDFDGGVDNRWWEAKSGNYWRDQTNTEKGFAKFRSDMGDRKRIADDNNVAYELFSNSPIPQKAKNYLDKKGIKYTEMLD